MINFNLATASQIISEMVNNGEIWRTWMLPADQRLCLLQAAAVPAPKKLPVVLDEKKIKWSIHSNQGGSQQLSVDS
jgi:hypothetical protein